MLRLILLVVAANACSIGVLYSSPGIDANTPELLLNSTGITNYCTGNVYTNISLVREFIERWTNLTTVLLPASTEFDSYAIAVEFPRLLFIQPWPTASAPASNLITLATPQAFYFRDLLAYLQGRFNTLAIINTLDSPACQVSQLAQDYAFTVVSANVSELQEIQPDVVFMCDTLACESTFSGNWAPMVLAVFPGNCASTLILSGETTDYRLIAFDLLHRVELGGTLAGGVSLIPNLSPPLVLNMQNQNEWQPQRWNQAGVGTLLPSASGFTLATLITPALTVEDINYAPKMFTFPEERVVAAFVVLFIVICCSLIVFLCRHREHASIRSASLPFSIVCIVGCMFAATSILTWPVENDVYTCAARIPLCAISYILLLYPLCAKTIRIGTIFQGQNRNTRSVSDKAVFLQSIVWSIPHLGFTVIWMIIAPLDPIVQTSDSFRPGLGYTECVTASTWLLAINLVLYAAGLVLALYASARAREAYALFNDAAVIALCVYNFAFVFGILLFIHLAWADMSNLGTRRMLFISRSFSVLFCLAMNCILLFGQRVLQAYNTPSTEVIAEMDAESNALLKSSRMRSSAFTTKKTKTGPATPPSIGMLSAETGSTASNGTTGSNTLRSPLSSPTSSARSLRQFEFGHARKPSGGVQLTPIYLTVPTRDQAAAYKVKHNQVVPELPLHSLRTSRSADG